MINRLFHPQPIPQPAHGTRTALSYSQFELALYFLCAQAIAYRAIHGHWPKLVPHDVDVGWEVWID